jgi:prepilin-type N-terminal cleavage/methylation domain-containing protein/prepilin-type processing-associated H-X9-DG protein
MGQIHRRRRGFTLVEMMMVILIIGLLMSLLLSAVQGARETARRTQCLQRMSHIGEAMQQFESAQKHYPGFRHYPYFAWEWTGKAKPQDEFQFRYSTGWFPQLFEYLGRRDLIDPTIPRSWKRPIRRGSDTFSWTPRMHQFVVCPSDAIKAASLAPLTSFVVNAGRIDATPTPTIPADWRTNGIFFNLRPFVTNPNNKVAIVKQDSSYITKNDGLSTTAMLTESLHVNQYFDREEWQAGFVFDVPPSSGGWPTFRAPYQAAAPTSNHPGIVNVLFADGHARHVRKDMDYLVYCALMTPHGAAALDPGSTTQSPPAIRNQPKISPDKL